MSSPNINIQRPKLFTNPQQFIEEEAQVPNKTANKLSNAWESVKSALKGFADRVADSKAFKSVKALTKRVSKELKANKRLALIIAGVVLILIAPSTGVVAPVVLSIGLGMIVYNAIKLNFERKPMIRYI